MQVLVKSNDVVIGKLLQVSHPPMGQKPKQGNKWKKMSFLLLTL